MGSFNLSCGLSNMSIREGEYCKILFLVKNTSRKSTTPSDNFTVVFPFFLNGVYEDYGNFKFTDNTNVIEFVERQFKERMFPVNQGKNKWHDIPVRPDNFSLSKVSDFIHENRLFLKNKDYQHDPIEFESEEPIDMYLPQEVSLYAIKKSLYDKIVGGVFEFDKYHLDGTYKNVTFKEMYEKMSPKIDDIPSYFKDVVFSHDGILDFTMNALQLNKMDFEELKELRVRHSEFMEDRTHLIDEYQTAKKDGKLDEFFESSTMATDLYNFCSKYETVFTKEEIEDTLLKKTIDDFGRENRTYFPTTTQKSLDYKECLNFLLFDRWFNCAQNGSYSPTRYAGQDFEYDAYKNFNDLLNEVIADERVAF